MAPYIDGIDGIDGDDHEAFEPLAGVGDYWLDLTDMALSSGDETLVEEICRLEVSHLEERKDLKEVVAGPLLAACLLLGHAWARTPRDEESRRAIGELVAVGGVGTLEGGTLEAKVFSALLATLGSDPGDLPLAVQGLVDEGEPAGDLALAGMEVWRAAVRLALKLGIICSRCGDGFACEEGVGPDLEREEWAEAIVVAAAMIGLATHGESVLAQALLDVETDLAVFAALKLAGEGWRFDGPLERTEAAMVEATEWATVRFGECEDDEGWRDVGLGLLRACAGACDAEELVAVARRLSGGGPLGS